MKRIATSKDMLFEQSLAHTAACNCDSCMPMSGQLGSKCQECGEKKVYELRGGEAGVDRPKEYCPNCDKKESSVKLGEELGFPDNHDFGFEDNDRDKVAEVWKRVENSIYQGPDSALPEVIKILESIPEVIALAATRERESKVAMGDQPGWVHPDHMPNPPGTKPTADKNEKPSPNVAAELESDIEYGYDRSELEDLMGLTDCPEGCEVEIDGVCEHGWLSAGRTLGIV